MADITTDTPRTIHIITTIAPPDTTAIPIIPTHHTTATDTPTATDIIIRDTAPITVDTVPVTDMATRDYLSVTDHADK